jgi:hypothetical protein
LIDYTDDPRSLTALPDGLRQRFVEAERMRETKRRWARILWAALVGAVLIYGARIVIWAVRLARV